MKLPTLDGFVLPAIQGPTGKLEEDRRKAWFVQPDWVKDPFGRKHAGDVKGPRTILLKGRYLISEAIRHSAKGGVYEAIDTRTGTTAIVKEARPHTQVGPSGQDARDRLRYEIKVLRDLESTGRVPVVVDEFELQDHLYLVETKMEGPTLRTLVNVDVLEYETVINIARALVEIVRLVHEKGFILRDFNPNNIIVVGKEPSLIDLEALCPITQSSKVTPHIIGTPGYASPQATRGEPPRLEDDYFSLGATILFLSLGCEPLPLSQHLRSVQHDHRLYEWLELAMQDGALRPALRDLIYGCMREEPEERWTPAEVVAELSKCRVNHKREPLDTSSPLSSIAHAPYTELLENYLSQVRQSFRRGEEWLWAPPEMSNFGDSRHVGYGAAGTLSQAIRVSRVLGCSTADDVISESAHLLRKRVHDDPMSLPGLYFGRGGLAWALFDAGNYLSDKELRDTACELALSLPTEYPLFDITHGLAGIGLTLLRLWNETGDLKFFSRAVACGRTLAIRANRDDGDLFWVVDEKTGSVFAGNPYLGFAHGVAGIAYFFLALAALSGQGHYAHLARAALDGLANQAIYHRDAVFWPELKGGKDRRIHWCHGSSGVGTTFVRGALILREPRYRDLAISAARGVIEHKWRAPGNAQCHGLSGMAELLIDLDQLLGENEFLGYAAEFARVVSLRCIEVDQTLTLPDDTGLSAVLDFNTGSSGVAAFMARLISGGSRSWMLDEAITNTAEVASSSSS